LPVHAPATRALRAAYRNEIATKRENVVISSA